MAKLVTAKVVQLARNISLLAILVTLFCSCASSNVSRDTAANVDLGVRNAKELVYGTAESDIGTTYGNSSQAAKGAILGGAAGWLIGLSSSSGIGVAGGIVTGAILGASYGMYIDTHTTLEDRLKNRGVNIIILGDQILIVLPSARIFNEMTSIIKPQSYSTLNMVADYVNRYIKVLVRVGAYTDNFASNEVACALAQQQADSVAKYLNAAGIDTRILYAIGYGGAHIVTPSQGWDSDNYRIEISLEKLYV